MPGLYLSLQTKSNNVFKKWFRKWHQILQSYEKEYKGMDLPYWCTERTNIGHLALAAHDPGGYPLQEYSTQKRRRGAKGPGRADLYVHFPHRSFNIECKQIWPSLDGDNNGEPINNALDRAEKDYRGLAAEDKEGKKGIALVFVVPYKKLADADKKDFSKFKTHMMKLEKRLKARFIAIHFANYKVAKRAAKKYSEKGVPYWYPGIAIIGRWIS